METIGKQKLWSFNKKGNIEAMDSVAVRHTKALHVSDFRELAKRVSELQFRNRDFVLLFRGQPDDYRNIAGNTTIRPKILRPPVPQKKLNPITIQERFNDLGIKEQGLLKAYERRFPNKEALRRLQRERILRWSILQHYEVCPTPLLDVTHSLRIAASFASQDNPDEAYVFVLGLPNLSGAITASVEAGLQIVRLASVCPPTALRPHIQEGYLLGEYPEITTVDQKQLYSNYEIDFGRRLVAKFSFIPEAFWKASPYFPQIQKVALYPTRDPLSSVANGQ